MQKLTQTTKVVLIVLFVMLGLFPLTIMTLYLRDIDVDMFLLVLNQALFVVAYFFIASAILKLVNNSINKKEQKLVQQTKQDFFNTLSEERDVKDISVMEVPIRDSKGKVIGRGTIYSDLKINYYTVVNYNKDTKS